MMCSITYLNAVMRRGIQKDTSRTSNATAQKAKARTPPKACVLTASPFPTPHNTSQRQVREADIVVCAAGRAEMVKADWIKPGAAVIDVGINSVDDDTSKKGWVLIPFYGCNGP